MSESGPDFYFRVVAEPREGEIPAAAGPDAAAEKSPPPLPESPVPEINVPPPVPAPAEWPATPPGVPPPPEAGLFESLTGMAAAISAPATGQRAELPGWPAVGPAPVDAAHGDGQTGAVATQDPAARAAGRPVEATPYVASKRRPERKASPLGRTLGVLISGLLGLACAYGLACWVDEKNDTFHIFHKEPSPPAPLPKGEGRNSPSPPAPPSKSDGKNSPSPPAARPKSDVKNPALPTARVLPGRPASAGSPATAVPSPQPAR